jgi:hypothetical protein
MILIVHRKTLEMSQNNLLNTRQVLRELALSKDDHAWRNTIKPMLVEKYGMRRLEKGGHRIFRSSFDRFIDDFQQGKIFNQ